MSARIPECDHRRKYGPGMTFCRPSGEARTIVLYEGTVVAYRHGDGRKGLMTKRAWSNWVRSTGAKCLK